MYRSWGCEGVPGDREEEATRYFLLRSLDLGQLRRTGGTDLNFTQMPLDAGVF